MIYKYGKEDYDLLIAQSKYSILISEFLSKNGPKNHGEICDVLKIKKNNLSNIVRKLEPFNIFTIRRIGKNVYYSLNFKGLEFLSYAKEGKFEECCRALSPLKEAEAK